MLECKHKNSEVWFRMGRWQPIYTIEMEKEAKTHLEILNQADTGLSWRLVKETVELFLAK